MSRNSVGKKTLSLDFDGVCHQYTSPWQGPTVIPDPHVPGLFDFLVAVQDDFIVEVYSTRSETLEGREAMEKWFAAESYKLAQQRNLDYEDSEELRQALEALRFPQHKPKAFVGLDDRIITFYGQWPAVSSLRNFKPWNKGGPVGVAVHMPVGQRTVTFSGTQQQIEDLRTLLFTEKRRGMVTGGSSVSAEDKRRRDTFEHFYNQLPPGLPPDVRQS